MSLPKANRLKRRQDFKEVYQSGLRRTGRYLTLRALPSRGSAACFPEAKQTDAAHTKQQTRIGISISQKVSKLAVKRNRIKRQIRAAFLHLLPRMSPSWRLVVVVRQGATECDYAQLLRELEQLLVEAEVLNGH